MGAISQIWYLWCKVENLWSFVGKKCIFPIFFNGKIIKGEENIKERWL